jgi:hypothetical protein
MVRANSFKSQFCKGSNSEKLNRLIQMVYDNFKLILRWLITGAYFQISTEDY